MNAREPLENQIARALESEPGALPFLPDLLDALDDLGSSPARLIAILDRAGFDVRSSVLDLGCGKGGFGVALAARGAHVVGIDGLPAFIDAARALAARHAVAPRCDFRVGDLRDAPAMGRRFGLVSLVSVGAAWGDHARTLDALLSLVEPGGLVLYEADWSDDGDDATPTLDGVASILRDAGVEILAIDTPSLEDIRLWNDRDLASIRAAADRMVRDSPELEGAIGAYVEGQERSCREMNAGRARASTFLLRRRRRERSQSAAPDPTSLT